jgi:flagellar hook-basal body complex protein FliE
VLNAISPIAASAGSAVQAVQAQSPAAVSAPTPELSSVNAESLTVRLGRELQEVRSLEMQARDAMSALQRGDRIDVEGVLLATRKADAAFQMLRAVQNAMLQAYAEIRDMRV